MSRICITYTIHSTESTKSMRSTREVATLGCAGLSTKMPSHIHSFWREHPAVLSSTPRSFSWLISRRGLIFRRYSCSSKSILFGKCVQPNTRIQQFEMVTVGFNRTRSSASIMSMSHCGWSLYKSSTNSQWTVKRYYFLALSFPARGLALCSCRRCCRFPFSLNIRLWARMVILAWWVILHLLN